MADKTPEGWLRPMATADLECILKMRNHSEIRRYMFTQHEISFAEHSLWFERATQNSKVELLVFELNRICCGFVQFKETSYQGVADWGFYADPNAPKGTGRRLGLAALTHAFRQEKLHKVCGQALHWNQPSIEFHKALGFTQEGLMRNQHFDGTSYHDLICFGLLKSEWSGEEIHAGTL